MLDTRITAIEVMAREGKDPPSAGAAGFLNLCSLTPTLRHTSL